MKYFQATWGLFGYGGYYKLSNNIDKSFWGLGFNGGANLSLKIGENSEISPFGLELTLGVESGEYYKFRKEYEDSSGKNVKENISKVNSYTTFPVYYRTRIANNTVLIARYALGFGGNNSTTMHGFTIGLNFNDRVMVQGYANLGSTNITEGAVLNDIWGLNIAVGLSRR